MGGWRIGRIGGVDIRIDPSWAPAALFFTFSFWTLFRSEFPALGGGTVFAFAVATSVLFFASVLAHELAHAGASRLRGIKVYGITLFLFGGATQAEVDAKGPADEFLIAVVGPLTSLVLGGLFLGAYRVGGHSLSEPLRAGMLWRLGEINLSLGIFNLLPGFPLDGGRLLRSILWRSTGSLPKATAIAARVGQALALAMIAFGVYAVIALDAAGFGIWMAFIGSFLYRAATSVQQQEAQHRLMRTATAADVMSRPPPTIPAGLPMGAAIDRFLQGHDGEAFPVVDSTGVIGFVSLRTARGHPPGAPIQEAMVSTDTVVRVSPADGMNSVAERLRLDRRRTALVMDGPRLVGVIEPEDLERFLRRRTASIGTLVRPRRTGGSRTSDTDRRGSG
jgi:Zn-dependent protease